MRVLLRNLLAVCGLLFSLHAPQGAPSQISLAHLPQHLLAIRAVQKRFAGKNGSALF
ncbi:MAG: hypothetical protein LBT53_10155 [Puniceicoccales bacterium]|nr:hypothetical protein [Puniceicoccales bacterium]